MANLRILYENQLDASDATLSASTSASSLVANNLRSDLKTKVHRSTGNTVTYTMTWLNPRLFNMAALIFTNLSSTATMRARVYSEATDLTHVYDSGPKLACAYQPLGMWAWGNQPLGVNAFRFGGASHGRIYFPDVIGKKLVIDVEDSYGQSQYIEASRLLCGQYWSPETNPEYGMETRYEFGTEHELSDAGDLRTERRPIRRGLSFNLSWLKNEGDQLMFHEIMMSNGMYRPIFISMFPESDDPALEQRNQMYCKLEGDTSMSHPSFGVFALPLTLREI